MTLDRRDFLTLGGVASLAALGPRLVELAHARPAGQPASAAQRWGLLIDADQCAGGCDACVAACGKENGFHSTGHPESDPQWIRKVELKDMQTGHTATLPVMCQHCESPPCVDVCPTGASFRRADGIVLVDKHICIGCRYCMMACPYKARSFVHEDVHEQKPDVPRGKGTVESCTLCVHRVDRDQIPACAEACRQAGHEAILFGDLLDPSSAIRQRLTEQDSTALRADLKLNPSVRYQGM